MPVLSDQEQDRSPLVTFLQWCRDWITDGATSGLNCCMEMEVERLAKDLQMSPGELRAVAKWGPGAADLLLRRMAALDLDPDEVFELLPQTFRDMQRVCTLCDSKRHCGKDIARDASNPAWKAYCPNADTLAALNAMPWTSRREW